MRVVLRFLVVVLLLTVLSPKFGWESVGAVASHAHAAEAVVQADHEGMADCHEHMGDQDGVAEMGDHHCCPGHVLGHLLGGVGGGLSLPAVGHDAALPLARDDRFSSCVPEGLERPPRLAA